MKKTYDVLGFDGKTILKQQKFKRDQVGYITNMIERFNNRELTPAEHDIIFFILEHDNYVFSESWKEGTQMRKNLMESFQKLLNINNSKELADKRKQVSDFWKKYDKENKVKKQHD